MNPAGQKAHSINPLNWKTDGTPADKSENLGACFTGYDGKIATEAAVTQTVTQSGESVSADTSP